MSKPTAWPEDGSDDDPRWEGPLGAAILDAIAGKPKGTEHRMTLTLEHFQRWLEGQIALGIDLHANTPFPARYINQMGPSIAVKDIEEPLYRLLNRQPYWTATELLQTLKRTIAQNRRHHAT